MNIVRKDAAIENTGSDDDFPGSFQVILSTSTKDRDGDELAAEDWEQPLPEHITFDTDHGMSVATTVGSGVPSINDKGQLVVDGTYSSLPRAQEARTLVKEKHIRSTSVAFLTKRVAKGGASKTVRELLNGAFVAIPSNTDAVVLSAKEAAAVKAGARNSGTDQGRIQSIHDLAVELGATSAESTEGASADPAAIAAKSIGVKTVAGSYEQRQQAINDALDAAYPDPPSNGYCYAWTMATFDDSVVYRVSGDTDLRGQWQASYTVNADGTVTLGEPQQVTMVETVVPVNGTVPKGYRVVAPTHIGKSATVDTEQSGTELSAAEKSAAAASEDAAAADDNAAEVQAASEVQVRAARIRAMSTLASLEGDNANG